MKSVENLITDNLDLWTAAIKTKSGVGRGSSKKRELYGINKLRELILNLAVRGLLVPQDPADKPAKELLNKIAAEKVQLIKEGKLKPQKPLPPIEDHEKAFELPANWTWTRLGDAGETNIGLTYSPKEITNNGIPVLRSSNVQGGKIDLTDLVRVAPKTIKESAYVSIGDLLICARNGSRRLVGKTAMIKEIAEPTVFGAFMAIYRSRCNAYFEVFINSPVFRQSLEGVSTTTINQITQGKLKSTVSPLPPRSEQHRIVAKVDELMALCDQLEQQTEASLTAHQTLVETLLGTLTNAANSEAFDQAWQRIAQHFDTLFTTEHSIDQLKQTILQLAVMGKLVPQDPNDEPARELVKTIALEKNKLLEDGKIKKQKAVPPMEEVEKPFELPKGWAWVRLQSVTSKITDGDHKTPPRIEKGRRLLSAKNVRDGFVDFDNCDFISEDSYQKSRERCMPEEGDLLIVSVGGTIGRSSLVPSVSDFALVRSVALVKPLSIRSAYLKCAMDSKLLQESIHSRKRGGAQPCLYLSEISMFPLSIPPIQEQDRIVAKVDELLNLCDELSSNLSQALFTKLLLTDATTIQPNV